MSNSKKQSIKQIISNSVSIAQSIEDSKKHKNIDTLTAEQRKHKICVRRPYKGDNGRSYIEQLFYHAYSWHRQNVLVTRIKSREADKNHFSENVFNKNARLNFIDRKLIMMNT